jgi:hypothetical protein
MFRNTDKESCSLIKLISIAVFSISVFVIIFSVFSKKQTLRERLKNVYDGLSPQDYE